VRVGFKTPLEQRYARRALLRMVGAGVGLTAAANAARGYETDYRPTVNGRWNPNFIRIRNVFGRDVSVFGPYDSILRLIVGTGAGFTPTRDEEGEWSIRPGEAINVGRGLGAPHVSLAWDVISGEDAIGQAVPKITELRGEDLPALGGRVAESFSPISFQNAPETLPQVVRGVQEGDALQAAGGVAGAVFEAHGGKSTPLSFTDEADRVAQTQYGKRWDVLTPVQQKVVRDLLYREAPEVMMRSAEKQLAEYRLRRLNAQGINMLKGDLNKLRDSKNADIAKRAREMLAEIAAGAKSTDSKLTRPGF